MLTVELSEGQSLALTQISDMEDEPGGALQLIAPPETFDSGGRLRVIISLDCADTPSSSGGILLRRRERFVVHVPMNFPFEVPILSVVHQRWAGTPHVQWGNQLCLYAAPAVEWNPADGMFGFVDRLVEWLGRAARGELDPDDLPLHPPVAYASNANGVMVIRADLGELAPPVLEVGGRLMVNSEMRSASPKHDNRLVVGITEAHDGKRLDLVEWITREEAMRRFVDGELPAIRNGRAVIVTVGVLTDQELGFEYPERADALIAALERVGVSTTGLFEAIGQVGAINYLLASRRVQNEPVTPVDFHLIVGTPSRRLEDGVLRQHLVCWRFDELGSLIAENIIHAGGNDPGFAKVGNLALSFVPKWLETAKTSWMQVMESRSEVTVRRDEQTSAEWVKERRVLVLGCGALGAPIAEYCVRAGATEVWVLDDGIVTPGILVRQPYVDADIGRKKADVLAKRLNTIRTDAPVYPFACSVADFFVDDYASPNGIDLIIDATANSSMASLLEARRYRARSTWPPVMTVGVGHDARRGIVTVSKSGATGAGRHILRRLALAARGQDANSLKDVADDFFPIAPMTPLFQPEPGCSSPTFRGSASELSSLAGQLFDAGLRAIVGEGSIEISEPMVAAVVRLDNNPGNRTRPPIAWFGWPNDYVSHDAISDYEVRISRAAINQMRTEVRRGARIRGPKIETGGMLIGHYDSSCKCIWVDDASGPPPDSRLSESFFDHGVEGTEQLLEYYRERTGGLSTFIGMWHSHPFGSARPSPTDAIAMTDLVTPVVKGPRRALVLILGGGHDKWSAWVSGAGEPELYVRFVTRSRQSTFVTPRVLKAVQGNWWPGGWRSRPRTKSTLSSTRKPRARRRRQPK